MENRRNRTHPKGPSEKELVVPTSEVQQRTKYQFLQTEPSIIDVFVRTVFENTIVVSFCHRFIGVACFALTEKMSKI